MCAAERLTRRRVIGAAIDVADADGLEGVTMRSVAQAVSSSPMALYQHIRNKEDLLNGMIEAIIERIGTVDPSAPWRPELRERSIAARSVLTRHPWAIAILDSRFPAGPAALRQHENILALLTHNGFELAEATFVYTVIDAFVYGFVVQDHQIPTATDARERGMADVGLPEGEYPHLLEFATRFAYTGGWEFRHQFQPGLDLILDAIAARHGVGSGMVLDEELGGLQREVSQDDRGASATDVGEGLDDGAVPLDPPTVGRRHDL